MKVTVICCSFRSHGNSEMLADAFIKGAKEAGHQLRKIKLRNYKMAPCLACEYCRSHDHQCVQKDDTDQIIQIVMHSDVFVFATPVYFYSLPAQLKMLIDRFFAREYEIREAKSRKKAYLILTAGTDDIHQTIGAVESFKGFIKVLRTVDESGIIYGLNLLQKGQAKDSPAWQEPYEMGLTLSY